MCSSPSCWGPTGRWWPTAGAHRGTGGWALDTFLARSDPTILVPARAFSHLEFKVKIDPVDGYIEVRLNQVTIMNLTGINTRFTANTETSQVAFAKEAIGGNGGLYYFDDMCLLRYPRRPEHRLHRRPEVLLPAAHLGWGQPGLHRLDGGAGVHRAVQRAAGRCPVPVAGGHHRQDDVGCANLPGNTASVAGCSP
jgi:hypothetical protein